MIKTETEYEEIINKVFGDSHHPRIPFTYIATLDDLLTTQIHPLDIPWFSKLYAEKPTTLSGSKNNSGIGKGEIALYWLLKYNICNKYKITANSKTSSVLPDLTVNDIGIEVKSFENNNIYLGRYQKDSMYGDLLEMLNISYSLSTITEYSDTTNRNYYTTFSINPKQLNVVFKNVNEVRENITKWSDKLYGQNITNAIHRLEDIYKARTQTTDINISHETLTKFFIYEMIKTKLTEKPGINGYIINISSEGKLKTKKITQELLDSPEFQENCVKHARSANGSLKINLDKIFE